MKFMVKMGREAKKPHYVNFKKFTLYPYNFFDVGGSISSNCPG